MLGVPRYPEFSELWHHIDQAQFYIPELEMTFGQVCSAMKKCWLGYKMARHDVDVENQEYYADIIQGIIEALGYRPLRFSITDTYDTFATLEKWDPSSMTITEEEQEVQEIDQMVQQAKQKRRVLAIEYGKQFKQYDWDNITKQYVRYVSPEDPEEVDYILDFTDSGNEETEEEETM